jgi:hypothetical protein
VYVITVDGYPVHGTGSREVVVSYPVLSQELDQAGTLTFGIAPTNPGHDRIVEMRSVVEVYSFHDLLWRGRVLSREADFNNVAQVTCEGVIGYLNDSILRPLDSYDSYDDDFTLAQLIAWVIARHNEQVELSKRLVAGTVSVTRPPDDDLGLTADYAKTRDFLESVRDKYGGHFVIRYEAEANRLNYVAEIDSVGHQQIQFGQNLINVARTFSGDKLRTSIIPLGASIGGERITIADVNGSKDYLDNAEAVAQFGRITGVEIYDDIDDEDELLAKAREDLPKLTGVHKTVLVTALDLSLIDRDIEAFKLGDTVRIISPPHGIDEDLQVSSIRLDMGEPDKSEITLGDPAGSITGKRK